jgi:hypothetical protein
VNTARRASFIISTIALTAALAACRSGVQGEGESATPSISASVAASASAQASTGGQPSPQPTDDLGPFACDLPVTGTKTVYRAQLVDVRVGTHDGYDRVVFEFGDGVPAFTLQKATPPLLEDASGRELDVSGNAFWQLVMRDASTPVLNGDPVLTKRDFNPKFPKLTELIKGGDFEAVITWYFGLDGESCVRVLKLDNPSRLVFDIEH